MLPKQRRISKDLFEEIFKKGYSFYTDLLGLKTLKRPESGTKSAFSVVVSSKVASKAVTRNYLKRRTRYVLEKNLDRIKEGFFCIINLKQDVSGLEFLEFEAKILDILNRANLLK